MLKSRTSDIIHPSHLTTSNILNPAHLTTSHIAPYHTSQPERSSWAEFLGRMLKSRVLGPDVEEPNIRHHTSFTSHHSKHPSHLTTSHIAPHHTAQGERREHKEQVLGPSSWAGWKKFWGRVLGPEKCKKVRVFSWKPRSRASQKTEKYENYHEKWASKKLKSEKSTKITTRNPFETLSRASQITEKYENYQEKWTSKKLKSRKLRKFTHKSRPRRARPARKYVNSHKTNMQARKHENSDEIRPAPRSRHPAFYYYRKNPKC